MDKIFVTKTYLPDRMAYKELLDQIWDSNYVTNEGQLARKLETQLRDFLHVPQLQWVSNGTIAIQLAIKSLGLTGEILTTPFTYVATANNIIWEHCTPIFVDIDPENFSIDVTKLEEKRTSKTQAILAVHIYGYPASVDGLQDYATKHGLYLLYDAAHAFGTVYRGKPLVSYGDVATLSFHATKVFHTIEGGAVICNDKALAAKIKLAGTHGHKYDEYLQVGINAKNSEFHAGIGLLNLSFFEQVRTGRKNVVEHYLDALADTDLYILNPAMYDDLEYNYAYFPILLPTEAVLLKVDKALNKEDIFPRRYFYPALNTLAYLNRSPCPVAEDVSIRIMCLPLYHDLSVQDQDRIIAIIKNNL